MNEPTPSPDRLIGDDLAGAREQAVEHVVCDIIMKDDREQRLLFIVDAHPPQPGGGEPLL